MNLREDYFTTSISQEFFDVVAGTLLGAGSTRKVYAFRKALGIDHVMKIEFMSCTFQNQREWLVWQGWKDNEDVAPWLAPCISVSPCGSILVQARTREMAPEQRPKKVPKWATDLKPENWGMYEGRPVIHDYGHIVTSLHGVGKLCKAKWSQDAAE